jgi:hypothetical protein
MTATVTRETTTPVKTKVTGLVVGASRIVFSFLFGLHGLQGFGFSAASTGTAAGSRSAASPAGGPASWKSPAPCCCSPGSPAARPRSCCPG